MWPRMFSASEPGPGWVRAIFGSISKANMAHGLNPRHVRCYFKSKHGAEPIIKVLMESKLE